MCPSLRGVDPPGVRRLSSVTRKGWSSALSTRTAPTVLGSHRSAAPKLETNGLQSVMRRTAGYKLAFGQEILQPPAKGITRSRRAYTATLLGELMSLGTGSCSTFCAAR